LLAGFIAAGQSASLVCLAVSDAAQADWQAAGTVSLTVAIVRLRAYTNDDAVDANSY
jgi:hypothetical protein